MRRPIKDDVHLEKVVNDLLDLKSTKNSGAVHNDGDGKGATINGVTYLSPLIDAKFSERIQASISLKKADWKKTQQSAYRNGRIPMMAVYNHDHDRMGDIFVVIGIDDFKRIYEYAKSYCEENGHE